MNSSDNNTTQIKLY